MENVTIYKGWTIELTPDPYTDDPSNDGAYKVVTFNCDVITDVTGADYDAYFDEDDRIVPAFRAKLDSGQAFAISYGSHGPQTAYRLWQTIPDSGPDADKIDGFIILDDELGPATFADRALWAGDMLTEYEMWANGECYSVSITDPYGDTPDDGDAAGMGGIIGYEYALDYAKQAVDAQIAWGRPLPATKAKHAGELHT